MIKRIIGSIVAEVKEAGRLFVEGVKYIFTVILGLVVFYLCIWCVSFPLCLFAPEWFTKEDPKEFPLGYGFATVITAAFFYVVNLGSHYSWPKRETLRGTELREGKN